MRTYVIVYIGKCMVNARSVIGIRRRSTHGASADTADFARAGNIADRNYCLVVITALIHLQRAVEMLGGGAGRPVGPPPGGGGFSILQLIPIPMPILFLLNGIGYLVLLAGLYLPALRAYRPTLRWLLILFAAVTVVMYLLIAGFRFNPIGLFDKAIEIALIALLLIEGRRAMVTE